MHEELKADPAEPSFSVERIYTKSSVFESARWAPDLLHAKTTPVMEMQVQVNATHRGHDTHEAVLTLQVTAKLDGNLLWRAEIQQAGLYKLAGFTEEGRKRLLHGYCMDQLYPYAASSVSIMAMQGGFPGVYLSPINFEARYLAPQNQEAPVRGEKMPAALH
jgi:preprotein translocase subunit SecB